VSLLRHGLPRAGGCARRSRRRDPGRSTRGGEPWPPLREGLPRGARALRLRSPAAAAAASGRRQLPHDQLGAGARRRRGSRDGGPLDLRDLRQRAVDDPGGLRREQARQGGPWDEQRRGQRAPLHGLGGHRLPRRLRRGRAGGLLRRPRSLRRAHHLGQQPRGDAPRPLLARDGSPRARRARDAHRHRHAPYAHDVVRRPPPPLPPQSDLAIANGIAHLLLERGTHDRSFVEQHTAFRALEDEGTPTLQGRAITFEDYRARMAEYTPERVEQISGVRAATSGCSRTSSAIAPSGSRASGAWA
jgi:hypothetical protein